MHKSLVRLFLTASLMLASAGSAWAIKANPRPVAVRLPDGSTLTVRIHGDENFNYVTTLDGFLVQRDREGYFRYVRVDEKNARRVMTAQRVHPNDRRTASEKELLKTLQPINRMADAFRLFGPRPELKLKAPEQILNTKKMRRVRASSVADESNYLVIIVEYADGKLNFNTLDFERWLNEPNYSVNGGTGSVKDYYRDNSMSQFIPHFTVLGPYKLDHEETYYAANNPETGSDDNPEAMVIEAVQKAKAEHPEINFAKFDNDGDGFMDNVNVIYSGYSEASSGNPVNMWPHSYNLNATNRAFQVDGITVNNYAVSAELVGADGAEMDGIGTFVHEFGHVLGFCDTYDTDSYNGGIGVDPGDFSLYASGSYNNNSRTPPYLMAFERQQMGWLDLTPVNKAEDVTLLPINQNEARYIDAQPERDLYTQGGDWFVLENRQKTGWDAYIPAHGLLVYHYDFTTESIQKYWNVNGPNNNANHRCLYIVPADGVDDALTRKGDTYPGITGTTDFTDETHPEALSWTGNKLRTPITRITEDENGLIHFCVKGGVANTPFIQTLPPGSVGVTAESIEVGAQIVSGADAVKEMGFCWSTTKEFPTCDDEHIALEKAASVNYKLTNLQPATRYYVRAYMTLDDGAVVYGASLPVRTEHEPLQAPGVLDFMTWVDGEPDRWKVIDRNGDGTTWIYDEATRGMLYQFDYWNNADDWLVSEKMHIPQRGTLYFVRGVTDPNYVERLEVYVSTTTRRPEDFHLVKSVSIADHFNEQYVEEVDLSDFAGKDVYVALAVKSEKLQGMLWIWQVMLTNRLETPEIVQFTAVDGGLYSEWTSVDNASKYFLDFYEVTNTPKEVVEFLPEKRMENLSGEVETGTGFLRFISSSEVETSTFADGITDLKFLLCSAGPRGTTTFSVEGSVDGTVWERVGELYRISVSDAEGSLIDLKRNLADKRYTRLRFKTEYGGRVLTLRNLTIGYTDGTVWNPLAQGGVDGTSMFIGEQTPGEFLSGKKYAIQVYAGDGYLFYDASAPAFYQHGVQGIGEIQRDQQPTQRMARTLCKDGWVRLIGLTPNKPVSLYATDGRLLKRFVPTSTETAVYLEGYRGIVIGRQP